MDYCRHYYTKIIPSDLFITFISLPLSILIFLSFYFEREFNLKVNEISFLLYFDVSLKENRWELLHHVNEVSMDL